MKKVLIGLCLLLLVGCNSKQSNSITINEDTYNRLSEVNLIVNDEEAKPFVSVNLLSDEELSAYGFKLEDFVDIKVCMNQESLDPTLYIIALPVSDKVNECKSQIQSFLDNRFSAYKDYNPQGASMIENKLMTIIGDYLICIVSSDNELVLKTIKG